MIEAMSETFTERAPIPLLPEANVAQQSLLERYGDQIVTFKGVTGPLGALVNLCPVKDMDPVKAERYAGDILQEAGFDIPLEETAAAVEEAKKKE